MNVLKQIGCSTVGKKYIMAGTGCLLFLFVVGHLAGNLQVFLGAEAINAYGHFLQSKPLMVWTARLGLLCLVVIHIVSAVQLTKANRAARPREYDGAPKPPAASYASRTMMMSGLIVASFIVYHLLHFTVQAEGINLLSETDFKGMTDGEGRHDVFGMMVAGFSQPLVSGFYVIAMGLMCLHLSHGVSSMFQSVGVRCCCPKSFDLGARVVAALVFLGYASIPVAILVFGYGR